jgi:hypothetical protein
VLLQEVRNLDHELDRDVERDAIIEHAEPSGGRACGETSCTGAPRPPGDLLIYPRVCLDDR